MDRIIVSTSLNNLAWLLATYPDSQRHQPEDAVRYARRAVELVPESGNDWNTLGVAYYRAGKWEDAQRALERSMSLRHGGDSFDWFFLSLILQKLGQPEEARQWYDKAVRWYHEHKRDDLELPRFQAEAARELGLPTLAPSQPFQNDKTTHPPLSPPQTLPSSKRFRMRATNLGEVHQSR